VVIQMDKTVFDLIFDIQPDDRDILEVAKFFAESFPPKNLLISQEEINSREEAFFKNCAENIGQCNVYKEIDINNLEDADLSDIAASVIKTGRMPEFK
jgi:predicted nuclease of restriction endonuclease-like RecB superfamily